jgi:hypothetical protein
VRHESLAGLGGALRNKVGNCGEQGAHKGRRKAQTGTAAAFAAAATPVLLLYWPAYHPTPGARPLGWYLAPVDLFGQL